MSRPPLNPEQSASGIAVDPRTLERVIPESRRLDGSVRKQIKIRPGFTPQEDVSRFRGTRQQAMDAAALPKGHILGWVAPSSESQQKAKGESAPPPNKNAKKRANQRARKAAEKAVVVKDSWEDEEDVEDRTTPEISISSGKPDGGSSEAAKGGTRRADELKSEPALEELVRDLSLGSKAGQANLKVREGSNV